MNKSKSIFIRKIRVLLLILSGLIIVSLVTWMVSRSLSPTKSFDGTRAYQDVLEQVAFGPRTPDSQAHVKTVAYIQAELQKEGWKTIVQKANWEGFSILNIIASRNDLPPHIIIGAHYDSRLLADRDPSSGRNAPVPGANDGASGVAILLELARTLPSDCPPTWLVFFDAEDNGGLDGREWIMGSRAFVSELTFHPHAAIIVDMIGDTDLNIFIERNSDVSLVNQIWGQAEKLGYRQQFIPALKYSLIDDHTPFLEAGIPAVDIIDFDYPYYHTAADGSDKVSSKSLQIVGETLLSWIADQK
jgi:glutaminyl-peptide cyclotransferase